MNAITKILLAGCVALLVAATGSAGAAAPAAERARALTPVTVAVLPIEPTSQAFYAKDEGFFRRQGLDVKIVVVTDPGQTVTSVLSGDAQFSSTSVGGLALLKLRNAPIRVIAGGSLHVPKAPTSALVAAPGKRITTARDLVGKHIGLDAENQLAHIGLLKWLKLKGVSGSDVRLTYGIPFSQMLGPLQHGDFDAVVIPEPFLTQAVEQGAKVIYPVLTAVCPRDCLSTAWIARKDVDRDVAARFRNAIQAASVWANKKGTKAASAAILSKYSGVDVAVIGETTRTAFATRLRPAMAQPWIDAYAEFGIIPRSFSALDLVK